MKIKKLVLLTILLVWAGGLSANSGPQKCPWTHEYGDKTEERTVTTRQVSTGREGELKYESCSEAIARDKHNVNKGIAMKHAGKGLDGDATRTCVPDFTPPPCHYTPRATRPDQDPQPRELEIRSTGTDREGNTCWESCLDAQRRAHQAWVDSEFGGHKEDAKAAIDKELNRREQEHKSASAKAKRSASMQKMGGTLAMAGAVAAGVKAFGCCSETPACPKCGFWVATTAALGGAGIILFKNANKNEGIADLYEISPYDGPDPNGPGPREGPDPIAQIDPTPTDPPTPGPGETPDPGDPPSPPGPEEPGPKANNKWRKGSSDKFRKMIADNGWKWAKGKITLPNGDTYSADDLNKPEFQKHMSSPEVVAFKNQMADMEEQLKEDMGLDDDLLAGTGDGESSAGLLSGGGGFAGYGKGGRGFGGGGGMNDRDPASKPRAGSDKDKNSVAGMSVKMGKDRVGVSQDSIFAMIHRRYQNNRKNGRFIE